LHSQYDAQRLKPNAIERLNEAFRDERAAPTWLDEDSTHLGANLAVALLALRLLRGELGRNDDRTYDC
jgi:hypothetical protein